MTGTRSKGFTLIEITVALGIFVTIITAVSGIYSQFTSSQRRDIADQSIQEDMRLALEIFNREARFGFGDTYEVLADGTFTFRNQDRLCVRYQLQENALLRSEQANNDTTTDCAGMAISAFTNALPVTDRDTNLEALEFTSTQAVASGGSLESPGFVQVSMRISARRQPNFPPVVLQSAVTSRQFFPYTP